MKEGNIMFETELLQQKIKLMKEHKAEKEFYRIKGLFNGGIVVPEIVQTFQNIYDKNFEFSGSHNELYEAIAQWLQKNMK